MLSLKNRFFKVFGALAFLILMLTPARANAEELKLKNLYLASCVNGGLCSTENKNITLEDRITLNPVLEVEDGGKKIYFSDSKEVEINGRKINPRSVRGWSKDISLSISKVESEERSYSNWRNKQFVVDTPTYKETPVCLKRCSTYGADARPTDTSEDINEGLGTMRFSAEAQYGYQRIKTSGKESVNRLGIKEDVHRLSVRRDNTPVGWATAYFNLPYIYGSLPEQVDGFIGADCADLIVGAYRKAGYSLLDYTNAAGLVRYFKRTSDVKEGDIVLFGNGWHVGMVSNNRGPNKRGVKMIHTLCDFPREVGFSDSYGNFSLLRFNPPK